MKTPLSQPDFDFSAKRSQPVFDVERVLGDLNRSFNPLHDECLLDYHVSEVREGYVYLSIAMPVGMTRVFVNLLGSLEGFFKLIDRRVKSKGSAVKSVDPNQIEARKVGVNRFQDDVFALFDQFIGQGVDVKDAVKQTNLALKSKNHPWASYDVVRSILSTSGRLKKQKR